MLGLTRDAYSDADAFVGVEVLMQFVNKDKEFLDVIHRDLVYTIEYKHHWGMVLTEIPYRLQN